MTEDDELLRQFIDAFVVFDELQSMRSLKSPATLRDALRELYSDVPGPLPPLYERLILSYRWPLADVGRLRLVANSASRPLGSCLGDYQRQRTGRNIDSGRLRAVRQRT